MDNVDQNISIDQKLTLKCVKCIKELDIINFDLNNGKKNKICRNCLVVDNKKCYKCNKMYSNKANRDGHLWQVHNININGNMKIYKCDQDVCDYESKNNGHLYGHLWEVHSIDINGNKKIYKCDQKSCEYESKTNGTLTKHLWGVHSININGNRKIHKCNQDLCEYECKFNSSLVAHKWQVHNINTNGKKKIHKCDQDLCEYECKSNSTLVDHKWQVHSININGNKKMHKCDQDLCEYECKFNSDLTKHKWQVHSININGDKKMCQCNQELCDFECKSNSTLVAHKWQVHSININNKKKIYKCDQDLCEYECKSNGTLTRHLWGVHNINTNGNKKMYKCDQDLCEYESKTNGTLTQHMTGRHDIGKFQCETCERNVAKITPYQSIKTQHKKIKICRKCYRKYTGYAGRVEEQMVKYLLKDLTIKPYVVLKDAIIKGAKCLTKRRPDLYLASTNKLHIMIECDEHQHRGYPIKCERSRMDEILDEISEGRVIFIRWNPHVFTLYNNKNDLIKATTDRQQRLRTLLNLVKWLIKKKEWPLYTYHIFYLFYSEDREDIVKEYHYKHVYNDKDFEKPWLITSIGNRQLKISNKLVNIEDDSDTEQLTNTNEL